MIDISVVIPAYNADKYLKQCLDSIFSQHSDLSFEVIVVDNASVDSTTKMLKEYESKYSNIKNVRLEENVGCYGARRVGLRHAEAKYLLYLDSDDYLDENAFTILSSNLKKYCDLDAIIFQYAEFSNQTGETFRICKHFEVHDVVLTGEDAFLKNDIPSMPWNRLLKLDVLRNNDIDFSKSMPDDVDFCFRQYPFLQKVVLINEVLIHYRFIPTSTSRGNQANIPYVEGFNEMIPRHLGYSKIYGEAAYWNKTFWRDFVDANMYIAKYLSVSGKDDWICQNCDKLKQTYKELCNRECNPDTYLNRLRILRHFMPIIPYVLKLMLKLKVKRK